MEGSPMPVVAARQISYHHCQNGAEHYDVMFEGRLVGRVRRHPRHGSTSVWTHALLGQSEEGRYLRTRSEAATALCRAAVPGWQGVAP